MKITICDDSIEDLINAEKILIDYKNTYTEWNYEIDKYSDSLKLFQKIEEGFLSDIYILDMIMPVKSGIDLGKIIKEKERNSIIIFITSSEEYALEAYDVQAVRYLVKPYTKESFFEALDYSLSLEDIKKEPIYIIKMQDGMMSVPFSKIEYIENISRTLNVYLSDGRILKSIFIRKSFENEIEDLLLSKNFIQVHKSFVINMDYVEKLTQKDMLMKNGIYIPISKKKIQDVKRKYLLFVADRYR